MLKIYKLPSVTPRQVLLFFLIGVLLITLVAGAFAYRKSQIAGASSTCDRVFRALPQDITNGINRNKADYVAVSNATGVPWELLASIHYRETSFSRSNPSNGYGIFQFTPPPKAYPAGPVSDAEFRNQLTYMANRIQDDYVNRSGLSYQKRKLVSNETEVFRIKDVLFSYNGRATVYANQAQSYGYNKATVPYEGSPYVMNMFDCQRASMGIITKDYGSIDGKDTRYGAFTLYARLKGDAYWQSLRDSLKLSTIHFEKQPHTNSPVTAGFTITNNTKASVDLGQVNIVVRSSSGENLDFPLSSNVTLAPGKSFTYKEMKTFNSVQGTHTFHIGRYHEGKWKNFSDHGLYEERSRMTSTLSLMPVVTEPLSIEPANSPQSTLHKDQTIRASFKMQNPGSHPVTIGEMTVAARDATGKVVDFPVTESITINPGQTYTYNKTRILAETGNYRFWISSFTPTYRWNNQAFTHADPAVSTPQTINHTLQDSVVVTSSLHTTTQSTPVVANENTSSTFTVKNFGTKAVAIGSIGVVGRDPDEVPFDLPMTGNLTLQPGQEYTYSGSRKMVKYGNYRFWISSKGTAGWNRTFPASIDSTITRANSFSAKSAVTITNNLSISGSAVGRPVEATFRVTNHSKNALAIGRIAVAVRGPTNNVLDMPLTGNLTLQSGASYTYKQAKTFTQTGVYSFWTTNHHNNQWNWRNIPVDSSSITRYIERSLGP